MMSGLELAGVGEAVGVRDDQPVVGRENGLGVAVAVDVELVAIDEQVGGEVTVESRQQVGLGSGKGVDGRRGWLRFRPHPDAGSRGGRPDRQRAVGFEAIVDDEPRPHRVCEVSRAPRLDPACHRQRQAVSERDHVADDDRVRAAVGAAAAGLAAQDGLELAVLAARQEHDEVVGGGRHLVPDRRGHGRTAAGGGEEGKDRRDASPHARASGNSAAIGIATPGSRLEVRVWAASSTVTSPSRTARVTVRSSGSTSQISGA